MVRLKEGEEQLKRMEDINFNSTMVRLKEGKIDNFGKLVEIFQFHYGSVKSLFIVALCIRGDKFQFHYGSVKRLSVSLTFLVTREFQFHYGSVKSDCLDLQA